jgi:hypothetical protein
MTVSFIVSRRLIEFEYNARHWELEYSCVIFRLRVRGGRVHVEVL